MSDLSVPSCSKLRFILDRVQAYSPLVSVGPLFLMVGVGPSNRGEDEIAVDDASQFIGVSAAMGVVLPNPIARVTCPPKTGPNIMLGIRGENLQKEVAQWPEKGTHRNRSSENSTEAEVFIAEGMTAAEAARKIGVNEQTYYRWRKE